MLALSRPLFRYLLPLWFSRFTLGDDYSFSSSFFDTRSIYNTHTHTPFTQNTSFADSCYFSMFLLNLYFFSHTTTPTQTTSIQLTHFTLTSTTYSDRAKLTPLCQ